MIALSHTCILLSIQFLIQEILHCMETKTKGGEEDATFRLTGTKKILVCLPTNQPQVFSQLPCISQATNLPLEALLHQGTHLPISLMLLLSMHSADLPYSNEISLEPPAPQSVMDYTVITHP